MTSFFVASRVVKKTDVLDIISIDFYSDGNTIIQSVSHVNSEQTLRNILNLKDRNVKYREETCNSFLTVQNFNKLVFIMNHACVTTRS